ncbi:hypothetical protein GDO81_023127 [Engystomops pustulosus]|uniref:Taste receptor type 2 n=1 Tax=Engystomops pustulosus TaxID=76066 RepID=A0AAV6ZNC3_ENGPU|nr:hypothetical protein GDO81_023127 [Engystomops pustulosus]
MVSFKFLIIVDTTSLLFLFPCNIFIFMVNILDWKKKRMLQISDVIITGISVSNLVYGGMRLLRCFSSIYNITSTIIVIFGFNLMSVSCNIWFSTWLCVYFCLKIVKIHNSFYIYLQRTFHKMLPWLLVLSVVESLLLSFFLAVNSSKRQFFDGQLYSPTLNVSTSIQSAEVSFSLYLKFSLVALVLFASSCFTITYTLCRHIKVLKNNKQGFQSSSTEAHIRATIIVVSLFVLCTMLFTNVTIAATKFLADKIRHFIIVLNYVCGVLSYVGLIKGNSKLHKTLRNIIHRLTFSRPST